jgi:transcriptional regulator with XRE-family HTH domain
MVTERRARPEAGAFGRVLRDWRHKRGLSQLDLGLAADGSQRHISFLESGRSQPSRDMVLRLAAVLDMPLREQNVMLVAAGFAPMYPARDLADPALHLVRKALDCMLRQQEPYPAMVIDRHWNLHMGNQAAGRLLTWLVDPHMAQTFLKPDGQRNLLRLLFHPDGVRPYIRNWHAVAGHLAERLHREAIIDGQSDTTMALLNELLAYPDVPHAWHRANWEVLQAPVLTVELVKNDLTLCFFTTITTLGTPHDITLQELHLECFFPADEATERNIEALNASAPSCDLEKGVTHGA